MNIFRIFLTSLIIFCSNDLLASDKIFHHKFSNPIIGALHENAKDYFEIYKGNHFQGEQQFEDFVNAYELALGQAQELDRVEVLRWFAASFWRIRAKINDQTKESEKNKKFLMDNLTRAQKLTMEAGEILLKLDEVNDEVNHAIYQQWIKLLLDEIKIDMSLYDGEHAFLACKHLLLLEPNDNAKLIAYRNLASLFFALHEFVLSKKYIKKAELIAENQSTELRHKARLIIVEANSEKPAVSNSLKLAETMITEALNHDTEYKQLLQDLQLLFTVWMMNPEKSNFDAYSLILEKVNNLKVQKFIKNKIRKKLRDIAEEMVKTQKRLLANELFKDVPVPYVELNEKRMEEVRAKLGDLKEQLAQKFQAASAPNSPNPFSRRHVFFSPPIALNRSAIGLPGSHKHEKIRHYVSNNCSFEGTEPIKLAGDQAKGASKDQQLSYQ